MLHNLSQPSWVTASLLAHLDELEGWHWRLWTLTPELTRLRTGPLLALMLDALDRAVQMHSAPSDDHHLWADIPGQTAAQDPVAESQSLEISGLKESGGKIKIEMGNGSIRRRRIAEMKGKEKGNAWPTASEMEGAFAGSTFGTRMTMYSAHAKNLAPLLVALGVYNDLTPPYAACLLIELHAPEENEEFEVRLYYKNDSNNQPWALNMPGIQYYIPVIKTSRINI